tara:strand:+ start:18294 stop:18833 length:540 start_codon:yes stop_codon:yes gene_type:complete
VHLRPVSAYERIDLVSIRDPVDRFNSAFHYRKGGFNPDIPLKALELELFDCFDDVDALAAALTDTSRCGELARISLRPSDKMTHITKNHAYYMATWLTRNPSLPFKVVQAENCAEDTQRVVKALGGRSKPSSEKPLSATMTSDRVNSRKPAITAETRSRLRAHMVEEYRVYREILRRGS